MWSASSCQDAFKPRRAEYHKLEPSADAQVAREANAELLDLPVGWEAADPGSLLAAVANELHSVQEPTRMAALLWLNTLLSKSRRTVSLPSFPVFTCSSLARCHWHSIITSHQYAIFCPERVDLTLPLSRYWSI